MKKVVGIDEAGRGAWAGPMISAAVIITKPILALNDSKKLTPAIRDQLYDQILQSADVGVGIATAEQIDRRGLTWAQQHTMAYALEQIDSPEIMEVIIDGSIKYIDDSRVQAIVKADGKYPVVMAASIVAKVTRDRLLDQLDAQHSGYGLANHKGYGTKAHATALQQRGPIPGLHRFSYKPVKESADEHDISR